MGFFALLSSYGSVQARLLALGFSATLNDLLGMSVLCNCFFSIYFNVLVEYDLVGWLLISNKYISPSQINLTFTTYANINSLKLKAVAKNFSLKGIPVRSISVLWTHCIKVSFIVVFKPRNYKQKWNSGSAEVLCLIWNSHKKQVVWKHGPNWPFYALMLRTKLY